MSDHDQTDPPADQTSAPPKASRLGCYLAPVVLILLLATGVAIRERQAMKRFRQKADRVLSRLAETEFEAAGSRTFDRWSATRAGHGLSNTLPDNAISGSGGRFDDESGLVAYQRVLVRLPDATSPAQNKETLIDVSVVMLRPWLSSTDELFIVAKGLDTAAQRELLERLKARFQAAGLNFTERTITDFDPRQAWQQIREAGPAD